MVIPSGLLLGQLDILPQGQTHTLQPTIRSSERHMCLKLEYLPFSHPRRIGPGREYHDDVDVYGTTQADILRAI
jgi:hypothetical protein